MIIFKYKDYRDCVLIAMHINCKTWFIQPRAVVINYSQLQCSCLLLMTFGEVRKHFPWLLSTGEKKKKHPAACLHTSDTVNVSTRG